MQAQSTKSMKLKHSFIHQEAVWGNISSYFLLCINGNIFIAETYRIQQCRVAHNIEISLFYRLCPVSNMSANMLDTILSINFLIWFTQDTQLWTSFGRRFQFLLPLMCHILGISWEAIVTMIYFLRGNFIFQQREIKDLWIIFPGGLL